MWGVGTITSAVLMATGCSHCCGECWEFSYLEVLHQYYEDHSQEVGAKNVSDKRWENIKPMGAVEYLISTLKCCANLMLNLFCNNVFAYMNTRLPFLCLTCLQWSQYEEDHVQTMQYSAYSRKNIHITAKKWGACILLHLKLNHFCAGHREKHVVVKCQTCGMVKRYKTTPGYTLWCDRNENVLQKSNTTEASWSTPQAQPETSDHMWNRQKTLNTTQWFFCKMYVWCSCSMYYACRVILFNSIITLTYYRRYNINCCYYTTVCARL